MNPKQPKLKSIVALVVAIFQLVACAKYHLVAVKK